MRHGMVWDDMVGVLMYPVLNVLKPDYFRDNTSNDRSCWIHHACQLTSKVSVLGPTTGSAMVIGRVWKACVD